MGTPFVLFLQAVLVIVLINLAIDHPEFVGLHGGAWLWLSVFGVWYIQSLVTRWITKRDI